MSTLKTLLLDKRLNTSELAARRHPTLSRPSAAAAYNNKLKRQADLPPEFSRDARKLATDILGSLGSEEKILHMAADKRLLPRAVAAAIWPARTADAAYKALLNRQHNRSIIGTERQALREYLQKLANELLSAIALPY